MGRKLLSLTLKLPYEGIDNAGGALVVSHYSHLSEYFDISTWAPDSADNRTAERSGVVGARDVNVVQSSWARRTVLGKVVALVVRVALPVLPDVDFLLQCLFCRRLRRVIKDAEVVEFQWFEYMSLGPIVRLLNPRAARIGVVHDVVSQSIERRTSSLPEPLRRVYLGMVRIQESFVLRSVSDVVVLSAKDRDLVCDRFPGARVTILDPPLSGYERERSESACSLAAKGAVSEGCTASVSFGMFAAFHRSENDDAANWLLKELWSDVIREVPAARLYLVGGGPSERLIRTASAMPSVQVTGYVKSMEDYYSLVDNVIIPLRLGAGVKFKTIEAMIRGKNLVLTSVASEGVAASECFFCLSDEAVEISAAMVELALNLNPEKARAARENALQALIGRYELDSYKSGLNTVYGCADRSGLGSSPSAGV
ncbi:glycosyltransferase [Gordonia sp. VNQ95]|uniref:glycosyltransferase n=1 Tax=Gordonia sp. VNQ95 TaxID=3156619 RepID=UPI0032B4A6F9